MPLDASFFNNVETLRAPRAGTELMGPLLYSLIRTTRPQNVLEVGMGYTTPFILQALQDNMKEYEDEKEELQKKNIIFIDALPEKDPLKFSQNTDNYILMDKWLDTSPALVSPAFYHSSYQPLLHAIDNYSSSLSKAKDVESVVNKMGLIDFIKIYDGDFRNYTSKLDPKYFPLNFVWFDCGGPDFYRDFLDEYWEKIDSNGGYLLLHCTLNRSGFFNVMNYLKLKQATTDFMNFELLNLQEPHKLTQGSVTIIRKTKNSIPEFPIERPEQLIGDIIKLNVTN